VEQIYTPEQIADYLQIHHLTVLKLLKNGKLEGIKIGRMYRITEGSIKKFLKSNKITA